MAVLSVETGSFLSSLIINVLILEIIMVFVNALILLASTKITSVKNTSFKVTFKISLILAIFYVVISQADFLPFISGITKNILLFLGVSIILAFWLIKKKYQLTFGKTLLVWIIWIVISSIIRSFFNALITLIFLSRMLA